MGIRGELYTTQVMLDNRSYFFNVKENRNGDVFLQVVESKNSKEGGDFDRHQIAIFAEDLQKFLKGMDDSLKFIEKDHKERAKIRAEKRAARDAKYGHGGYQGGTDAEKRARAKSDSPVSDGIKRTGRVVRVVSKRPVDSNTASNEDSSSKSEE